MNSLEDLAGVRDDEPVRIVLLCYALISLATFALFGWDKRAARLARPRVPERVLHTMEVLGGFPGAWLGRGMFRHKSRKKSYTTVLIVITILHLAVWSAFLSWRSRS